MSVIDQGSKLLRITEILYLSLSVLSFYLLIASRAGEAHTVWEVLHPAFISTLFVTSFLLLTILFTSEKTTHRLLFIIVYSVLIHSLFSIIFPVGDLSGQQIALGRTRRIYDNTILHGLSGWPTASVQVFIVEMFKGINLQAALSTILARMFSIDIVYVHLSYIPVLWGVFVPIASFLTTKAIGGSEKASVLSSLLVSTFPYTIYFGAISVPNSFGFIFFSFSLYFMLKYLSSNDSKTKYKMVTFSFFSFFSHYLTGIMSFSLLLLAVVFKSYKHEKRPPSATISISLVISFIVCLSLLPMSFIYLRFFDTSSNTVFTLAKFYELPIGEILGLLFLGELIYGFDLRTILLVILGPVLALLYMMYLLYKSKNNHGGMLESNILFLFMVFLMMLIDYRILKLFMEGLPLNAERLWVFRDLVAAPFVGLAIYAVISTLGTSLKATSPLRIHVVSTKAPSKGNPIRISSLFLVLNILIPAVVGGWVTVSLGVAYPHVAPLQTTYYELEAVRYIEENTHEKYVVIGDIWTIYAGEVIVGVNNPRAYYFAEFSKTGYDLFVNMKQNTSPQWMLQAMNYTNTTVAYFIVTEPRLTTEEFNDVVSSALQNEQITMVRVFGDGKLYVFSCKKE